MVKYKKKKFIYRSIVPIKREFKGRSKVAQVKIRHKGRFIKLSKSEI